MVNPTSQSPEMPFSYWNLRPREIVELYNATSKSVPLALLGDPGGEVVFTSTNPGVATVDGGLLRYGTNPGAAVIIAEATNEGQVISRRYMQVDIFRSTTTPSAPKLDWQPSGYVDLVDDGMWRFRYFDEWYDSNGGNIRVTGELSSVVTLDRDYSLVFEVWGQIESVHSHNHDTLEVWIDDECLRRLNPDVDTFGDPRFPYVVARDEIRIDLSGYTGPQWTLRFKWDTQDETLQRFDGWYVEKIRLEPNGGR